MARVSTRHIECKPIKFTADMCGKNTRNYIQYILTLVLFTFSTCCILRCLVCIVVRCLVCIVVRCLVRIVVSCLVCIFVILCVFVVICVHCCFKFRCRTAG